MMMLMPRDTKHKRIMQNTIYGAIVFNSNSLHVKKEKRSEEKKENYKTIEWLFILTVLLIRLINLVQRQTS